MTKKLASLFLLTATLSPAAILFTPDVVVSGTPGATVVWNIDIENTFALEWLLVSAVTLNSDPSPYGLAATYLDLLSPDFLLSALAPATGPVSYSLAAIDIDPLSPFGLSPFINLELTYLLFDGDPLDPFNPGNLIGDPIVQNLAVRIEVQEPLNPIPEPGTWCLAALGIGVVAFRNRRHGPRRCLLRSALGVGQS